MAKTISVIEHYDLLIEENNDPVQDPPPLQDYMDQWDGQKFIDKMELNNEKDALEIGVGTGRLAVRVAPRCRHFCGIDISAKTIARAKINLAGLHNTELLCGDFLTVPMQRKFDVIYSSLTWMHMQNKPKAMQKVAALLANGGKFVLSTDKNQNDSIDFGARKIKVFPDKPNAIRQDITESGLLLIEQYETEFAHIFVSQKG